MTEKKKSFIPSNIRKLNGRTDALKSIHKQMIISIIVSLIAAFIVFQIWQFGKYAELPFSVLPIGLFVIFIAVRFYLFVFYNEAVARLSYTNKKRGVEEGTGLIDLDEIHDEAYETVKYGRIKYISGRGVSIFSIKLKNTIGLEEHAESFREAFGQALTHIYDDRILASVVISPERQTDVDLSVPEISNEYSEDFCNEVSRMYGRHLDILANSTVQEILLIIPDSILHDNAAFEVYQKMKASLTNPIVHSFKLSTRKDCKRYIETELGVSAVDFSSVLIGRFANAAALRTSRVIATYDKAKKITKVLGNDTDFLKTVQEEQIDQNVNASVHSDKSVVKMETIKISKSDYLSL